MTINKVSNDTQKSMLVRTLTGISLAVIGVPCIILGDWFFIAIAIFVTSVAVYEMLHITGKKYPWFVWVTTYIAVFSFVFWVFFQKVRPIAWFEMDGIHQIAGNDIYGTHQFLMSDIRISTAGFAFYIALLITYSIISKNLDINDVFYLFAMSLFLGITIQSVLFLRLCPAILSNQSGFNNSIETCGLIAYVIGGVFLNDIFAYFTGVLFGKHKMAPVISPKKTWEGFAGGIILSTAVTVGVVLVADLVFDYKILAGIIDAEHWYLVVLISALMALCAVIGDLMFSMIKRHYNIKDFGNIFPGHGGVLDRFDSLFITALLVAVIICLIYYHPLSDALPEIMLGV